MFDDEILRTARNVLSICHQRKFTLATAESCTGGLVVAALTEIEGSSAVVDRGFVTYSNAAKEQLLGVPTQTLKDHGAVSRQTAEAMAEGVLAHAPVDLAVSITGIAGPGGGSDEKPVGLVHFGGAARSGARLHRRLEFGDIGRGAVRRASVMVALEMLRQLAESKP